MCFVEPTDDEGNGMSPERSFAVAPTGNPSPVRGQGAFMCGSDRDDGFRRLESHPLVKAGTGRADRFLDH